MNYENFWGGSVNCYVIYANSSYLTLIRHVLSVFDKEIFEK